MCYPFYARYLPNDDDRRLKRPTSDVRHNHLMFNLRHEVLEKPTPFNYNDYINHGLEFNASEDSRILAVNGVKGVWAFEILPYAHKIWMTKDRMHTGDHVVKDSLNMLSKSVNGHVNRTEKKSVRNACLERKIFPFLYAENGKKSAP